jgi:hypothetical protein
MDLKIIRNKMLCAAVVLLCLAATCGRDTRVKVEGGVAPDFILTGSGSLGYLQITGPKIRDAEGLAAYTDWEIVPIDGYLNGRHLSSLSPIHYGQIPAGYRQKYPEGGQQSPALVEGQTYTAIFDTTGANRAVVDFTIRDGRAVFVRDPMANVNRPPR